MTRMFQKRTSKRSCNLCIVLLGQENENLVRVDLGMYAKRKFSHFCLQSESRPMDPIYTSHFASYLCTSDQKGFISFFNRNQISLSQQPPPRLKTILKKNKCKHIPNTAQISYYISCYLLGYTEGSEIKEIQTKLI